VGVIDSGWDRTRSHERVAQGIAIVSEDDDFGPGEHADDHDRHGHGTLCTRLLLHGSPDAVAIPVRVFGSTLETSPIVIERAIDWCMARNIKLVNLSLGTTEPSARDRLYRACREASDQGMIIVAAARQGAYPSVFDAVLSVGLRNDRGGWRFEYHADAETEVLMRRGDRMPGGRPIQQSSFAAPCFSAVVARLLQRQPDLTLATIRQRLAEAGVFEDAL
jgi:hypothetical protein